MSKAVEDVVVDIVYMMKDYLTVPNEDDWFKTLDDIADMLEEWKHD